MKQAISSTRPLQCSDEEEQPPEKRKSLLYNNYLNLHQLYLSMSQADSDKFNDTCKEIYTGLCAMKKKIEPLIYGGNEEVAKLFENLENDLSRIYPGFSVKYAFESIEPMCSQEKGEYSDINKHIRNMALITYGYNNYIYEYVRFIYYSIHTHLVFGYVETDVFTDLVKSMEIKDEIESVEEHSETVYNLYTEMCKQTDSLLQVFESTDDDVARDNAKLMACLTEHIQSQITPRIENSYKEAQILIKKASEDLNERIESLNKRNCMLEQFQKEKQPTER